MDNISTRYAGYERPDTGLPEQHLRQKQNALSRPQVDHGRHANPLGLHYKFEYKRNDGYEQYELQGKQKAALQLIANYQDCF